MKSCVWSQAGHAVLPLHLAGVKVASNNKPDVLQSRIQTWTGSKRLTRDLQDPAKIVN